MQPRIYTYKITFEEIPHWYWGVHKEKRYNDGYMGSPVTHKWMWEFYTPKIQILEVFPFTDEGWKEACKLEKKLIRPDLNNSLCLNEGCNVTTSRYAASKGGKVAGEKTVRLGRGIHSTDYKNSQKSKEARKKGGIAGGLIAGAKAVECKLGVHSPEYTNSDKYIEDRVKGGQISGQNSFEKGTKIFAIPKEEKIRISSEVGQRSYEEKFGMFAPEYVNKKKEWSGMGGRACKEKMPIEKQRERAKKISSEKWMCLVTGYITTKGPLTNVQKALGVDPRLRVRVESLLSQQLPIILAGI